MYTHDRSNRNNLGSWNTRWYRNSQSGLVKGNTLQGQRFKSRRDKNGGGTVEDSHMWEAADVWSIILSSHPLYTPLSVRAPCFPQAPSPNSPVDEHYLSLLIYSFSLVRVEQWRRGGLSVTLALLLQKSRMFHSNLHNVLYYAPSLTSAVNSQGQKENFSVSPTSISPTFILTKHFWGTLGFCPSCDVLAMSLFEHCHLQPSGQTFINVHLVFTSA